jgi:hypothetical protein
MKHFDGLDDVHEIGVDHDGHLEHIAQINHDEIDRRLAGIDEEPERTVGLSDVLSALMRLLYFATASNGLLGEKALTLAGTKIHSLLWLLNPTESPYNSMADIARAAGCTRACLSAALLKLTDQIGLRVFARQK